MRYIEIPNRIKHLAGLFHTNGSELYIVGGYVRNQLLGLPYTDIDICSPAPPQKAGLLAMQAGFSVRDRHVQMGTLDIFDHELSLEYTPFRTESYGEGGAHRPEKVIFTDDIKLDAGRRDFRCNAVYANAYTGEIADPLGGVDDIIGHRLSACREDAIQTLKDDGLRLLRMARFAAELGFSIHPELFRAAKKCAANIDDIPAERIAAEISRISLADIRYGIDWRGIPAHYRAMRILDSAGILGRIYPELMEGKGMGQLAKYHAYDVFNHNMQCYKASFARLELRLAALFHDVAKPHQAAINKGGKMYGHDEVGAKMARKMLLRTGFSKGLADSVCLIIARHMFDLDGKAKASTCRKRFARWGFDFTRDLISMREADIQGSGRQPSDGLTPQKWTAILGQMISEGAIDSMDKLAVDGRVIMDALGIRQGDMVGKIKDFLFERVALSPGMNKPELLLSEARRYYTSMQGK